MQFYEVKYSDSLGVFASVTHDSENRPVASTDRAGRVTRTEYWPTGQVKRRISPDGNFIGYEYDIEGRLTKVWESVPEQNSAQATGPFGGSKDVALTKTIEYYYGVKNDGTTGQNLSWTGTQLNAGTYIAAVRTFTYKGAGPVYYDMAYTSNAHGQPEKTFFIDSNDSTTRTTTRLYTWRGKPRRVTNPDTNYIAYEWDDHLRMTAEKLNGDTEKYTYEYCLCGAIKRHKYTYEDSLSNSQTETWTETTDDLGRKVKEYYPYPIAVDGSDEYHSLLYEHDTASRRKLYSDPTFGHTCADTTGWDDNTEPFDEENWVLNEPQRYLYGMKGGLEATGRVASSEIMAGQGEPYFVERDKVGRIAKVSYPDDIVSGSNVPQLEWQYSYGGNGQLTQVAAVNTMGATDTTYGPQAYVVQFFHDDVGRLVRKVVRDNMKQDTIDTHYESKLEYDGRGQTVREQIIKYDSASDRMQVMSDIQTTYDLGRNPITVKVYDNSGWAYTETRTYAKGYQLTGFSTSAAAGVVFSTSGSYSYDANNNLTTTKKLDASRGGNQLAYRAEWMFTYDRKNRLKSYSNTNANYTRGNLWYDGRGRVWQRWNDNSNTSALASSLTRFIYDGSTLAQELIFDVENVSDAWVYTYDDLTRDYLRQPGGIRQRERVTGTDTDYYLQANQGKIEFKVTRGTVATTGVRNERKSSLDHLPSSTFTNISSLATSNGYIEMYGGSTSGSTAGFDGLVQMGGRHYLAGLGRFVQMEPLLVEGSRNIINESNPVVLNTNGYMSNVPSCFHSCGGGTNSGPWGILPILPPPWWPPDWPWPPPPGWTPWGYLPPWDPTLPNPDPQPPIPDPSTPVPPGGYKPGHFNPPDHRPLQPPDEILDPNFEYCWPRIEICGLEKTYEMLDMIKNFKSVVDKTDCVLGCAGILEYVSLLGQNAYYLWLLCIINCFLPIPDIEPWEELFKAAKKAALDLARDCTCDELGKCLYGEDTNKYDQFSDCCQTLFRTYPSSLDELKNGLSDCNDQVNQPQHDPHLPPYIH
jgi:YD repeat-containing protein